MKEKKKPKKQSKEKKIRNKKKGREKMGEKIQRQSDELKIKNGLLKNGAEKQIKSEEQIHIFNKALKSIDEGIFIIDIRQPGFPVTYANRAFQEMTGHSKEEILNRNYFHLYGDEMDSALLDKIKQTIQKKKSVTGLLLEFQKNGSKHWNLLRITPVKGAGDGVTHYIGIQTDITPIKEKEEEIVRQRESLLHVTRVGKLAEFVSSLAHEINQPLTSILSYAQASRRMLAGKEPEIDEILSHIISDNQRAAQVIRRMRSLLKKSEPEMKPLDINEVVIETTELISTDASVRKVSLDLALERTLPPVKGDRIQLQQVLLNLISNSFDALEKTKSERKILLRTSLKGPGAIIVEVKDTGCGIPEDNMPKLAKRFFTSKADGLGMGLSISRSIVQEHGGNLEIENNKDRGVTVSFTLPAGKNNNP
ncbi:MAG: ATP-binding protein [Elusimicrobiota bacterium]